MIGLIKDDKQNWMKTIKNLQNHNHESTRASARASQEVAKAEPLSGG